jgi:hypothetical protein
MENETEFVPVGIAAKRVGYTYPMVLRLAKRGIIPSRRRFGHPEVNMAALIEYRQYVKSLGAAKHALRYPTPQEAPDASPTE